MFITVISRVGIIHIVDYYSSYGRRYNLLCGEFLLKTERLNILSLDNSINGICINCKKVHDKTYNSDLENDLSRLRNKFQYGYYILLDFAPTKLILDNEKYFDRSWSLLHKYTKMINRHKKYD